MRTLLIQLLCLLVGPFFLWPGASGVVSGLASRAWPVVPGEISARSVVVEIKELETSLSRSRWRKKYRVETQYSYEAEGRRLTGNRIFLKDISWSSSDQAEKLLALYNRGCPVSVSYKPGEPETAVLQPGPQFGDWSRLIIGIVLCGYGSVGAVAFCRYLKQGSFPE